jgi:hypothetical protein
MEASHEKPCVSWPDVIRPSIARNVLGKDCRVKPGSDAAPDGRKVAHNSLALVNMNDEVRRVFSSRIRLRVIGGSARWLQFSRSHSRQLTPIGVPWSRSRSKPWA